MQPLVFRSHYLPQGPHQLHLCEIYAEADEHTDAILMLHGSIENGRIFYSEAGKGLACYLARCGFRVFVADMRGRGLSQPPLGRDDGYGQYETIVHDLPLLHRFVYERAQIPIHWIAHSWGGVLMTATLARFPQLIPQVASQVYFGTKRYVSVRNIDYWLKIKLIWQGLSPLLCRLYGYLPARRWRLGADNETTVSLLHSIDWVTQRHWIDPVDQFDYQAALKTQQHPPTWWIAASRDRVLGHPRDVRLMADEVGTHDHWYTVLGVSQGHLYDYDHINMLTHKHACDDHFPAVADWLIQHAEVDTELAHAIPESQPESLR